MVGVHQRIDRVARKFLKKTLPPQTFFPLTKTIIHFEGNNGPDGIKRKSPSIDEPWHFINPADKDDRNLLTIIMDHHTNLVRALKNKDEQRSGFEAAWLAHAIVDGLTPAHHYPLGDKIEELWGKPHHERTSVRDKNLIKGVNRRDTIAKNWKYWGKDGIFAKHLIFESGVATAILIHNFHESGITKADLSRLELKGFEDIFMESLHDVAALHMYEELDKKGWTRQLANQSRDVLVPRIIKTVCLAWYDAAMKASQS